MTQKGCNVLNQYLQDQRVNLISKTHQNNKQNN